LKNATKNFMKEIREKLKSRLKKKSLSINFRHWSHSDPLYLENGKSHAKSIGILHREKFTRNTEK
jgi:hypothetical protein